MGEIIKFGNDSFEDKMNRALSAYRDRKSEEAYCEVVSLLFNAIEDDLNVQVPANSSGDNENITLGYINAPKGKGFDFIISTDQTAPSEYQFLAEIPFRNLLRLLLENNMSEGIIINPCSDTKCRVMKELFYSALNAVAQMLDDAEEDEDEEDSEGGEDVDEAEPDEDIFEDVDDEEDFCYYEASVNRPISTEQYNDIMDIVGSLTDDEEFLINIADERDDAMYIEIGTFDDDYYVEVVLEPLDDDDEDPRTLAGMVDHDGIAELLEDFLVRALEIDDIDILTQFEEE